MAKLSVREIITEDIPHLIEYWVHSDPAHMEMMGVDLEKLPSAAHVKDMLLTQTSLPYPEKPSYAIIWLADDQPIGHCNINNISFGEEANMHLHIWNKTGRRKGLGSQLLPLTFAYFFKHFQLKKLICEPYALNPAPNRTLEKMGFRFVKEYITIPGPINFEQPVKRWELTYEAFLAL